MRLRSSHADKLASSLKDRAAKALVSLNTAQQCNRQCGDALRAYATSEMQHATCSQQDATSEGCGSETCSVSLSSQSSGRDLKLTPAYPKRIGQCIRPLRATVCTASHCDNCARCSSARSPSVDGNFVKLFPPMNRFVSFGTPFSHAHLQCFTLAPKRTRASHSVCLPFRRATVALPIQLGCVPCRHRCTWPSGGGRFSSSVPCCAEGVKVLNGMMA